MKILCFVGRSYFITCFFQIRNQKIKQLSFTQLKLDRLNPKLIFFLLHFSSKAKFPLEYFIFPWEKKSPIQNLQPGDLSVGFSIYNFFVCTNNVLKNIFATFGDIWKSEAVAQKAGFPKILKYVIIMPAVLPSNNFDGSWGMKWKGTGFLN